MERQEKIVDGLFSRATKYSLKKGYSDAKDAEETMNIVKYDEQVRESLLVAASDIVWEIDREVEVRSVQEVKSLYDIAKASADKDGMIHLSLIVDYLKDAEESLNKDIDVLSEEEIIESAGGLDDDNSPIPGVK